jgi:lysophospholipase L1-like esterase
VTAPGRRTETLPAMLDDKGVLRRELTLEGLHPNDAGYAVMEPLAEKAIDDALKQVR